MLQMHHHSIARFRRNGSDDNSDYVHHIMIRTPDIDTRNARRCLHAGRLQAGV